MMRTFAAAALAAALVGGASPAQAQTAERVWDNGSVWTIDQIETKPGMFDDYMKYVSTTWRAIQEAEKKAGYVRSYKVMMINSPRDHEPDVLLMVEYANMAAFDRSLDEGDAVSAGAFGSVVQNNQGMASRESLRTTRGTTTVRELKFVK